MADRVKSIGSEGGSGCLIDTSSWPTSTGYWEIGDNLASAWSVRQGATTYIDIVTTNGSEAIALGAALSVTGSVTATTSLVADTIAERTSAAGVTVDGLLIKDNIAQGTNLTDPGNAGAIPVTKSGSVPIVTAGAETRTLAIPTAIGQTLSIIMKTDGGDCVVTVASAINQAGNTIITLGDAGDNIHLIGVHTGTALAWRVLSNDGAALS